MNIFIDQRQMISLPPAGANVIAPVFEAIVTQILARDQCSRVRALQRAVDEYPQVYAEYLAAVV